MNTLESNNNTPRKGCTDMWNAFMTKDVEFTLGSDIPVCSCDKAIIPHELISYVEAKHIYNQKLKANSDFHVNAYVHFYIDDQKFDGLREGIWAKPYAALDIIRHFAGAITPDFSTNADFPDPIKRYNTYRMRLFGCFLVNNGITVINNVRWGTEETWDYCFDGIPFNSIVAIGTVASGINKLENRPLFNAGFDKMINLLAPRTIIVYGSANYDCFKQLSESGIQIISFPSQTSLAFSAKKGGDQHE